MLTTHERRVIDQDGKAIEVVLPIAEFEQLKAQAQAAEIVRRFAAGASLVELSEDTVSSGSPSPTSSVNTVLTQTR